MSLLLGRSVSTAGHTLACKGSEGLIVQGTDQRPYFPDTVAFLELISERAARQQGQPALAHEGHQQAQRASSNGADLLNYRVRPGNSSSTAAWCRVPHGCDICSHADSLDAKHLPTESLDAAAGPCTIMDSGNPMWVHISANYGEYRSPLLCVLQDPVWVARAPGRLDVMGGIAGEGEFAVSCRLAACLSTPNTAWEQT